MEEPDPQPLIGSVEREAVDSLRGYSYQMLRSIQAWLDLAAGEILVLEGAEDLDQIGLQAATTEQVKDTAGSGNVTLRSKSVLEAIGNFWGHLERNMGTAVRFRFLTTSGVGRENGRPLGLDERGLDAWRLIQAAPTGLGAGRLAAGIQSFLQDQATLPATMRGWLGTATHEEFISRIVTPIEWVTGWPDWQDLRRTVEAKLVELCETRGLGSSEALAALDALHLEVWRVATTKGARVLRRGDLLRIVDAAGTTAVPKAQLLALMQAFTKGAPGAATMAVAPEPFGAPPIANPNRHARPVLESRISAAGAAGAVLIHGATGMGKTGLALAAIGSARPVTWVDLRDIPPLGARARIESLATRLLEAGPENVVLDDLPLTGDPRTLEAALGNLLSVQARTGGALFVTASGPLPPRLAAQLGLDTSRTFAAPAFEQDDIREHLLASGCPEELAVDWSKILHASTSGHPQLVDARVAALRDARFPPISISELVVTPPEILDARAEARSIVATRPPDDRELLARVSLLLGRAPRERLMAVARIDPPIAEPGDVIDRLTGPWLERMGSGDLRQSPLLRNLGNDTRGQDWAVAMHRGIAFTFLRAGSMFASDVMELATHAMLGRTAASIIPLLPSLLQASEKVWGQIADTASMLTYFGIGEGISPPFPEPADTAAFRVLQARIAVEIGDCERLNAVLDRAFEEAEVKPTRSAVGEEFFHLLLLWQVLQKPTGLPLERRLTIGVRFARVGERVAESMRGLVLPDGTAADDAGWPDLTAFLPMALIPVVTDAEELARLLDLIERMDVDDRAVALRGYAGDGEAAAMALDRVWLGEASRPEPRWTLLAATLERAQRLAGELEAPELASAAAPLRIRVVDENLRDPAGALTLADGIAAAMGESPRVLAAKGRVLTRQGRAPEALPLYETAIGAFPLTMSWRTDVLRDAGFAAGKAGDWTLAADRLLSAIGSLDPAEPPVRRIGLLFDQAIALHLAGCTPEAVDRLGDATDLLVADGRAMPPEPLVSVRQFGSQVVNTIAYSLKPDAVPDPEAMDLRRVFGSASAMEELRWGGQTPANLDLFILIMVELDMLRPAPWPIAARLAGRLRGAEDLLAQLGQGAPLARLAVDTLEVADSALDAVREARAITFAEAERAAGRETLGRRLDEAPGEPPARTSEMIKVRLLSRIVPLLARRAPEAIPIARWLVDLPVCEATAGARAMLEDLERLLTGSEKAASRILTGNGTWEGHLLATLLAPLQAVLTPEKLLICHSVAARYLRQPGLGMFVAREFSDVVTDGWLARCDSPAQLVAPRVTVPAIRAAATGTVPGWPRVAAVLSAAMSAVAASAATSVREAIREISE